MQSIAIQVVVVIIVGAWCICASFADSRSRSNCYCNDSSITVCYLNCVMSSTKSLSSSRHTHADNSYYQISLISKLKNMSVTQVTFHMVTFQMSPNTTSQYGFPFWALQMVHDMTQIRPWNDVCFFFTMIKLFITTTSVDVGICWSYDLAEFDGVDVRWCLSVAAISEFVPKPQYLRLSCHSAADAVSSNTCPVNLLNMGWSFGACATPALPTVFVCSHTLVLTTVQFVQLILERRYAIKEYCQARRKPQRGRETFLQNPQTFSGARLKKNFSFF